MLGLLYSRPKVKSPPQDILLKLQQDHTMKEASEASSMFVFKLGLAKLKCSFLMNGLVFESVEVLLCIFFNMLRFSDFGSLLQACV